MFISQDTEMKEGIESAKKEAQASNKPILVSEVSKIKDMDALSFYAAGGDFYKGERFFWKDPSSDINIVGLGICKHIESDQSTDRFFLVEKEWKRLIKNAFIYNPYKESGLGPTLFGGFSFDPNHKITGLWSNFSNSFFYLPKFMLTIIDDQYFLTSNLLISDHQDKFIYEKMNNERNTLMTKIKQYPFHNRTEQIKKMEVNKEKWVYKVNKIKGKLKHGPLKKVVLARELRLIFNEPIVSSDVLSRLIEEQQSSFIFALESGDDCFIGASPERLVKKKEKEVLSTCLAGSISRGSNPQEDDKLGQMLLTDKKNLVEHQIVVDMIKEAMSSVCENVNIPSHPKLMKMRDIQHLYTPVIGKLEEDKSLFILINKLHPTPALGGFPTNMALEIIRELEEMDRGLYGGPIGWIDYHGDGEFAVSIRSGLIKGSEASIFAGCGIIANSDAESEFQETGIKFRPMLSALGGNE